MQTYHRHPFGTSPHIYTGSIGHGTLFVFGAIYFLLYPFCQNYCNIKWTLLFAFIEATAWWCAFCYLFSQIEAPAWWCAFCYLLSQIEAPAWQVLIIFCLFELLFLLWFWGSPTNEYIMPDFLKILIIRCFNSFIILSSPLILLWNFGA